MEITISDTTFFEHLDLFIRMATPSLHQLKKINGYVSVTYPDEISTPFFRLAYLLCQGPNLILKGENPLGFSRLHIKGEYEVTPEDVETLLTLVDNAHKLLYYKSYSDDIYMDGYAENSGLDQMLMDMNKLIRIKGFFKRICELQKVLTSQIQREHDTIEGFRSSPKKDLSDSDGQATQEHFEVSQRASPSDQIGIKKYGVGVTLTVHKSINIGERN